MPFDGEIATGESLLHLERSKAVESFEGVIRVRKGVAPDPVNIVDIDRDEWLPRRVVAIDGSSVTTRVQNGFPGAEASLITLSVVFIDLTELDKIDPDSIPSPRVFNNMDTASSLDAVLPGSNIVRDGNPNDTPKRFFRSTVFNALNGTLDAKHESLLGTLQSIIPAKPRTISCPGEDCDEVVNIDLTRDDQVCASCQERLFPSDSLRFHERFNENGSNGEVHGEVRHVIEVLSLINILRFFEHDDRIAYLRDCVFVLDGPLAVFGQPAWIAPYVRNDIIRISEKALNKNSSDIVLFGVEKSGQYVSHFHDRDWTDEDGPASRYARGTVIIPDAKYINRNITFRPENAKPSGVDTYFGRKIFYKNNSGSGVIMNAAMVNNSGKDFHNTQPSAFPRLGHCLNVLDHLSTYLYEGGFIPLVRAHAHAAVPLKRGSEILSGLFPKS